MYMVAAHFTLQDRGCVPCPQNCAPDNKIEVFDLLHISSLKMAVQSFVDMFNKVPCNLDDPKLSGKTVLGNCYRKG
jgi:hypothetical protein